MAINRKMLKKDLKEYLDKNKVPYKSNATKEELFKIAQEAEKAIAVASEKPVEKPADKEDAQAVQPAPKVVQPVATIAPSKPSKRGYIIGGVIGILIGAIAIGGVVNIATPQNIASYNGGQLSALQVVNNSASTTSTQSLVRNEVVNGILINMFGSKQADKEANAAYAKVVTSYGSKKKALSALSENGYTPSTYKKMVVQSYLMNKYVKDKYITSAMAKKAYKDWVPDQAVYVKAATTSTAPKTLSQLRATSANAISTFFTRNGFTAYNVGSSTELSASALAKIASLKNGQSASISMGSSNVLIVYMQKHVPKTSYAKDKNALYTSLASQYLKDTATKSKIVDQLFSQGNLRIPNSTLNKGVRDVSSTAQ